MIDTLRHGPANGRSIRFLALLACALVAHACDGAVTGPEAGGAALIGSLELEADSAGLLIGDALDVAVVVHDTAGATLSEPPVAPTWSVSDTSVLSVVNGRILGVGPGEAWAKATAGKASDSLRVRVYRDSLSVETTAYLVQAIQRRDGSVPLIAGRDALLRVFVTSARGDGYSMDAIAHFYQGDREVHSVRIDLEADTIPTSVNEGDLRQSLDAVIPGAVLQPGTGLVIELDPDRKYAMAARRYPADGRLALDVRAVPPMELRVVPVDHGSSGTPVLDQRWIDVHVGWAFRVHPIGDASVEVRPPYYTDLLMTSTSDWTQLYNEIELLRETDGSDAYYYGAFKIPSASPYSGMGGLGARVAIGRDQALTLAHELGHNFGMNHTSCTDYPTGEEAGYPYPDGHIAAYGYDLSTAILRIPERDFDLMSGCAPRWVSDYTFEKVMAFRDSASPSAAATAARRASTAGSAAGRRATLVVWGELSKSGLHLQPTLVLDLPPASPHRSGPYRATGYDAGGRVLFATTFAPTPLGPEGAAAFLVRVPATAEIRDGLARVEVTGPGGRAVLIPGSERPVTAVVDRATGRLLTLDRDGVWDRSRRDVVAVVGDGVRSRRVELQPQL